MIYFEYKKLSDIYVHSVITIIWNTFGTIYHKVLLMYLQSLTEFDSINRVWQNRMILLPLLKKYQRYNLVSYSPDPKNPFQQYCK